MKLIIVTFVIFILGVIFSFLLGFSAGKFRGAKDGIDYCFDRYTEAAKKNLYKDKEVKGKKDNND